MQHQIGRRGSTGEGEWNVGEKLYFMSFIEENNDYDWNAVSKAMSSRFGSTRPENFFSAKQCTAKFTDLMREGSSGQRRSGVDRNTALRQSVIHYTTQLVEENRKAKQLQLVEYRKLKREMEQIIAGQFNDQQLQRMLEQARLEDKQAGLTDQDEIFVELRQRLAESNWRGDGGIWNRDRPFTEHQHQHQHVKEEEAEEPMEIIIEGAMDIRSYDRLSSPDSRNRRRLSTSRTSTSPRKSTHKEAELPSKDEEEEAISDSEPLAVITRPKRKLDRDEDVVTEQRDEEEKTSNASIRSAKKEERRSLTSRNESKRKSTSNEKKNEEISDADQRVWKAMALNAWRSISAHRHAGIFAQPVSDRDARHYSSTVKSRMDLTTLKRQIESGEVSNSLDMKRRLLLMFANATMFNSTEHDVHQYAREMVNEALQLFKADMDPDGNALSAADAAKLRRATRTADLCL